MPPLRAPTDGVSDDGDAVLQARQAAKVHRLQALPEAVVLHCRRGEGREEGGEQVGAACTGSQVEAACTGSAHREAWAAAGRPSAACRRARQAGAPRCTAEGRHTDASGGGDVRSASIQDHPRLPPRAPPGSTHP